jgi:hypothetical protein
MGVKQEESNSREAAAGQRNSSFRDAKIAN